MAVLQDQSKSGWRGLFDPKWLPHYVTIEVESPDLSDLERWKVIGLGDWGTLLVESMDDPREPSRQVEEMKLTEVYFVVETLVNYARINVRKWLGLSGYQDTVKAVWVLVCDYSTELLLAVKSVGGLVTLPCSNVKASEVTDVVSMEGRENSIHCVEKVLRARLCKAAAKFFRERLARSDFDECMKYWLVHQNVGVFIGSLSFDPESVDRFNQRSLQTVMTVFNSSFFREDVVEALGCPPLLVEEDGRGEGGRIVFWKGNRPTLQDEGGFSGALGNPGCL